MFGIRKQRRRRSVSASLWGHSFPRRDGGRRRHSLGGNVPGGGGSSRGDLEDHDEKHQEGFAHKRGKFRHRRGGGGGDPPLGSGAGSIQQQLLGLWRRLLLHPG